MKVRLSGLFILLIAFMLGSTTSLWAGPQERTMSLDELFQLADSVSLTLKSAESQSKVADATIAVAENGLLPDINFTASATYNGNAWMADRNFSNGQNLDSPPISATISP